MSVTMEPRLDPAGELDGAGSGSALRRWMRRPAVVAFTIWLVTVPIAFAAPAELGLNPFEQRDADVPLAALFWGALVLILLGLRWRGPWVAGLAAGLYGSYLALVLRTALSGTPFAYEGVHGDTGRIAAMAMRYTVRWIPSDGIVSDVAAEYPPLFPYTIGKLSVLLDIPAWRLMGPVAALTVSVSVVAAFALWVRLVPPPTALAICVLTPLAFGRPDKAYELLALAVFIPLVLAVLARPPRGRPHWLPAGLIIAAMCLTYYAYVVYAAIGLAVLGWWTWRGEEDRGAYLRYLARIVAVVAVATAWFTVPYAGAVLDGGQQVADLWPGRVSENPFPFLEAGLLGILQLVGLGGLLWYSRTAWWATPLLLVCAGCYAYQAIGMTRWVATGHTSLFYYTRALISTCLIAAAVLTATEAVPALARRVRRTFAAHAGVVVMAVVLGFAAFGYWSTAMPVTSWSVTADGGSTPDWTSEEGRINRYARFAHLEHLPEGGRPRYAAFAQPGVVADPFWNARYRYLPVSEIERTVRQVRPHDARPRILSADEQIFAYLPWRGYIGVDRFGANAPVRWNDRHDELVRVAQIADPAAFAAASAATRFGPIDVFVLRREGSELVWRAVQAPVVIRFQRSQFGPAFVVQSLGPDTFLAVRQP